MAEGKDFFISYTGVDTAWAEWIAQTLEDAGYQTVLQAWDFRAGTDFLHQMHQATQQATRTIAVLSPAYLGSASARRNGGWRSPPTRPASSGCCCRYGWPEVTPPGLLRSRTYLDLVGLDEPTALARLVAGVRSDRAKPEGRRPFPGGQARAGGVSFPGRHPRSSRCRRATGTSPAAATCCKPSASTWWRPRRGRWCRPCRPARSTGWAGSARLSSLSSTPIGMPPTTTWCGGCRPSSR
jgi:hypothetical protein